MKKFVLIFYLKLFIVFVMSYFLTNPIYDVAMSIATAILFLGIYILLSGVLDLPEDGIIKEYYV